MTGPTEAAVRAEVRGAHRLGAAGGGGAHQPGRLDAGAGQRLHVAEHVERRAGGERIGAERGAQAGRAHATDGRQPPGDVQVRARAQDRDAAARGGAVERLRVGDGQVHQERAFAEDAERIEPRHRPHAGHAHRRQRVALGE